MTVDPNVLKDVPFSFGALRVSSMINTWDLGATVEEKETTNAASGGHKERIGVLRDAAVTCSGFWRERDSSVDPDGYLHSLLGVSHVPLTARQGGVAYLVGVVSLKHTKGGEIGELQKFDFSAQGDSPLSRGKLIEEYAGADDHNSASITMPAVASGKRLYLAVHVYALSGTSPTLDITVQSDADNTYASPAARFVVPQFTAAGYHWASIAGPITDTEFRVACNTGGTSPIADYAVLLGIV